MNPRKLTNDELAILATLTPHARMHAHALLVVRPLLRVVSGRRSVERNRAVGGVPNSWHLKGRAVDFGGPNTAYERAALADAKAQRITAGCTGPEEALVHDAGSGMHLHVAW